MSCGLVLGAQVASLSSVPLPDQLRGPWGIQEGPQGFHLPAQQEVGSFPAPTAPSLQGLLLPGHAGPDPDRGPSEVG